jgi:hypothetical protein
MKRISQIVFVGLSHKKVQVQVFRMITLVIFFICISCSKNWHSERNNESETSQVTRGKTKDGSCIIVGHCYDFNSKGNPLPGFFNINGVVLEANNGFFKYYVWPGEYNLRAGFIFKKWALRSVKIEKGDSVHVSFYLKDDDTPIE